MRNIKLWIWLFALSAILNILLYAQLTINRNKPAEQAQAAGTYEAYVDGTLLRYALDWEGNYCTYKPYDVMDVGGYEGLDENQIAFLSDEPQKSEAHTALLFGENLYVISGDGSVRKYEKTVDYPYYDNVPDVLTSRSGNK